MIFRYILAWIPMVFIGIINDIMTQTTYGKYLNELLAHQIPTVTRISLFGIYIWGITSFWPLTSMEQAIFIGLIWLLLTVSFEFIFGHYIAGHSWNKLLADYNIFAGRVWILILIWITIAPLLFYYFIA